MTNVVILSGYPLMRRAMFELVRSLAPKSNIVEFGAADDAIVNIEEHPVDLVMCGRSIGAVWRADWLADLVAVARPGKVIVLSDSIDPVSYEHDLAAGANGFITLTSSVEVATAAIKLIMAGGTYFPPVRYSDAPSRHKGLAQGARELSPRQQQVLKEIERGQGNKEIASRLGISVATVKLHVRAILRVTGAKNRTGAVTHYRDNAFAK